MKFAFLFMLFIGVSVCSAQTTDSTDSCGLMVMAHGGSEEWNAEVRRAVISVSENRPTSIAYGMANPVTMKKAIAELEEHNVDCIAIVRLFISAQSFLHQTEYLLGLREDPPSMFISHSGQNHLIPDPLEFEVDVKISKTALLDAPEVGEILALNAIDLSDRSGTESVLIIAHGAGDDAVNDAWLHKMDLLANTVRETDLFHTVAVHSLREDWEEKRAKSEKEIRHFVEAHSKNDGRVIVLPFRLSGFGPYAEVLENLSYISSGIGLLPHPKISTWIQRISEELFAEFNHSVEM